MHPVEGGLWIALGASMALAALTSFYVNARGNFVQRAGVRLISCLGLTPFMFAMLGFVGGLVLLAWQVYQYLRFGNWPGWKVAHTLYVLDAKFDPHLMGRVGFDQIVLSMLDWSALLALLLILPGATVVLLGLLVWFVVSLSKTFQY
jgi:hypothetical protein